MGERETHKEGGRNRKKKRRRQLSLEPRLDHWILRIVDKAVNGFVYRPRRRRDEYDEYFGAGQLAAIQFLTANPSTPESHLRRVVNQAIIEHWQMSNHIPIPPSTRRRWIKKGKEIKEFRRRSWDLVFDHSGEFRLSVLREFPHWQDCEQMVLEDSATDIDWIETTEPFRRLQEFCVDDADLRVFEARWDKGQGLNNYTMLHVNDVATRAGLRPKETKRRLTELQRRYYAFTGRKLKPGPMPCGTRPNNKMAA